MKKKKILLVGNDLVVGVKKILDEKINWEVIYIFQGGAGLEVIKKENPDLVIMDLFLSDGNALYVASASRCIYGYKNKIIVVLYTSDVISLLPIISDFLSINDCSLIKLDMRKSQKKLAEEICDMVFTVIDEQTEEEGGACASSLY